MAQGHKMVQADDILRYESYELIKIIANEHQLKLNPTVKYLLNIYPPQQITKQYAEYFLAYFNNDIEAICIWLLDLTNLAEIDCIIYDYLYPKLLRITA